LGTFTTESLAFKEGKRSDLAYSLKCKDCKLKRRSTAHDLNVLKNKYISIYILLPKYIKNTLLKILYGFA